MPKENKDTDTRVILAQVNESITENDTVAYGESLKFKDTEQVAIISDITNYISNVEAQRTELGIEQEWKDCLDLYNGVLEDKTFPHSYAHNLHVHITSMVCDILAEKVRKNSFVNPMMLAMPEPSFQNYQEFDLAKKQAFVNDKFYGEMEADESLSLIVDDAIKIGTGIGKIKQTMETMVNRVIEIYEPTLAGLAKYMDDFSDQKKTDKYKENLILHKKKIRDNEDEPLSLWVEKEEIVKYHPELMWVDPVNLYIDCYTKDLRYNRIIAEKIGNKSWQELVAYFDTGYFDKENDVLLEDIKKKYRIDDEYKKRKYTIWECNIRNLKYKNKDVNAIVTYIEEMPTKLAKAISFPYATKGVPNYIIWRIQDSRNSVYGIGLPSKLKATNIAINEFWNLQLDSADFTIAPVLVGNISSPNFDPSNKQLTPGTVLWLGANDKITQLDNAKNLGESYKLLEYLHRYAEWITGVSAYMAGQAAPMDPRAPASKAFMLLQESNLRILAYIHKIDASNVKLFQQIDSLYYQYYNESVKYFKKSDDVEYEGTITRKELGVPVDWYPQLSDITINKALEKEENFKMAAFLQSQPMVMKLPSAQRKILEIILRAQGGVWEKSIKSFLPDNKETDVVNQLMSLMEKLGPQGIMDLMASMMQGSSMPGETPPAPVTPLPPAPAEATAPQGIANTTMQGSIPRA